MSTQTSQESVGSAPPAQPDGSTLSEGEATPPKKQPSSQSDGESSLPRKVTQAVREMDLGEEEKRELLEHLQEQQEVHPPRIELEVEGDSLKIQHEGGDSVLKSHRMSSALGTTSHDTRMRLLKRLVKLTKPIDGLQNRQEAVNGMLATLYDMQGLNSEADVLQAINMLAADQLAETMLDEAFKAKFPELQDQHLKWVHRFSKLFAEHKEILEDSDNEPPDQTVRVERVELQEGSQAVMGNFPSQAREGEGSLAENGRRPHAP